MIRNADVNHLAVLVLSLVDVNRRHRRDLGGTTNPANHGFVPNAHVQDVEAT